MTLQFDTAEPVEAKATVCDACQTPLHDTYYELNTKPICTGCQPRLQSIVDRGFGGIGVFAKAAALGLLAAIVGSAAWYGIRAATEWEIGIVAIAVGILVGIAVRKGAGNRGGWLYQALAMFLTYNAAVMNYAPDIVKSFKEAAQREQTGVTGQTAAAKAADAKEGAAKPSDSAASPQPSAASDVPPDGLRLLLGLLFLYGLLLAVPFLAGASNVLGIIIIGIGVYEAWKINRRPKLEWSGPYQLAHPPMETGAGGG